METLSLEELQALPQEQLINRLLEENKEKARLAERVKEVEAWAVEAATKLNQTKKELEEKSAKTAQLESEWSPDKVSEIVERTLNKKETEKKVQTVASQLPDSIREQFINQYKEIVWDRDISPAEVDKFINATLSIVAPDAKSIPEASLAIGWGQSWDTVSTKKEKLAEAEKAAATFFAGI